MARSNGTNEAFAWLWYFKLVPNFNQMQLAVLARINNKHPDYEAFTFVVDYGVFLINGMWISYKFELRINWWDNASLFFCQHFVENVSLV